MTLNDELIGAYLDGEMSAEERAELERALASNNGAATRLERLRGADELLRSAMRDGPAVSSTDALLRKALIGEQADDDPIARRLLGGAAPPAPRTELWVRRAAAVAAACLIGILAGRVGAPQGYVSADMRLGSEVSRILDSAPSGEFSPIARGEMGVALSFRADDGSLCRQFRTQSGQSVSDAIACRDGEAWRLAAQAAAPTPQGFQAASGAADPIAAAAESMGAAVLSDAEEREFIAASWRSAP